MTLDAPPSHTGYENSDSREELTVAGEGKGRIVWCFRGRIIQRAWKESPTITHLLMLSLERSDTID